MSVNDRLTQLSLEQKAALTSGNDMWHTEAAAGLPRTVMTDGPHGVRKRLGEPGAEMLSGEPATCFPPAVAMGSTWDPELIHQVGIALGKECRAMGVSILLGPGVNLKRSPLCGRNFEYYSEDPILAGILATEWVKGLQSQQVGASLKHFALNSQETDRMRVSAEVDQRTMREVYLRAFQRVVQQAQPWTVMCAYNRINGIPAANHYQLLTQILRQEWGFQGIVVSDWGAVIDRVASLAAGLDLTMPGPDPRGDRAVAKAIETGELSQSILDTSVSRILALMERANQATDPTATYDVAAHHALARQVAGRAIVLLKNHHNLLPLPTTGTSIAVIGQQAKTPRYQGGGSSQITPTQLDNALDEIKALTEAPVTFAAGYQPDGTGDENLLAEAVSAAAGSDVAVIFAGTAHETEGSDRTDLELPATQVTLIQQVVAANPRTVVVLSNGAVLRTSNWDTDVPALLEGWLLGQAGGGAIADVLFGRVNPSGRLAETIPNRLADHPSYLDFPGEASQVRYGEGLHIGYRGFDARQQEVAYPFGFGLSYTTFEYRDATAAVVEDQIQIRVPVSNTGKRDGREVVQVYAALPSSRMRRPLRELKGFTNLAIPAGQTIEAVVNIPRDDLASWDPQLNRWVVEGGEWHFAIGASSRDLRVAVTLTVAGDDIRVPLTAGSSLAEWLDDPRGAQLLQPLFEAAAKQSADPGDDPGDALETGGDASETSTERKPSGAMSGMLTDEHLRQFLGSLPISRLGAFGGELFPPEVIEQLVAQAND